MLRGGANSYSKEMIAANEKTFSSHERKMKHIIPKHNESSWNTLERSHAEGERKKDETSLSHRHHKNFSFIHSYNWENLLFFHDTLVWTLASFLMICTNHDKDGKEILYTHTLWDDMCEMLDNHPLFRILFSSPICLSETYSNANKPKV